MQKTNSLQFVIGRFSTFRLHVSLVTYNKLLKSFHTIHFLFLISLQSLRSLLLVLHVRKTVTDNTSHNHQTREKGYGWVVFVPANEVPNFQGRLPHTVRLLHIPLAQVVYFGTVVGVQSLAQPTVGLGFLYPFVGDKVVRLPPGMRRQENVW